MQALEQPRHALTGPPQNLCLQCLRIRKDENKKECSCTDQVLVLESAVGVRVQVGVRVRVIAFGEEKVPGG